MQDWFIQGIGFAAVAVFILSYQIKSNRTLFLLQLIGSALFCVQFFLLDAKSGCLSLAVNMLRNALMMKYNDWGWVRKTLSCGDRAAVHRRAALHLERSGQPARLCCIRDQHLRLLVEQSAQDPHGQSRLRVPVLADL